jgi:hypothetical protein
MGVEQVIAYVVVCDSCEDSCDSWTDYDDEENAIEWARECGWVKTANGWFCPTCQKEDIS